MAKDDTRVGAVSGIAAGILIIVLTMMAFAAFHPEPAMPATASEASSSAAASSAY